MIHAQDDQFLTIPEPPVPWRDVRIAEFDARRLARGTLIDSERDLYQNKHKISFEVSGELFVLLIKSSRSVGEQLIDVYLKEVRKGLRKWLT
jgi:hypothetical protein